MIVGAHICTCSFGVGIVKMSLKHFSSLAFLFVMTTKGPTD